MRWRAAALTLMCLAAVLPGSLRAADDQAVFACNYTIELSIDGSAGVITHQDRVRNNSHIPIYLQDYQLRLGISTATEDSALVEIFVLEHSDNTWREIYPQPVSFEATLGAPTEFSYRDEFLEIEIALIVSLLSP